MNDNPTYPAVWLTGEILSGGGLGMIARGVQAWRAARAVNQGRILGAAAGGARTQNCLGQACGLLLDALRPNRIVTRLGRYVGPGAGHGVDFAEG